MRKFVKKIQKSDEGTKTLWTWILTIALGSIVILAWIAYLNLTVDKISFDNLVNPPKETSFRDTFAAGVLAIRAQAAQGARILNRENLLDVIVPQKDFVYNDLEKIMEVRLP